MWKILGFVGEKQARKLQATLEDANPKLWLTYSLTDGGVRCRATSVAKKNGPSPLHTNIIDIECRMYKVQSKSEMVPWDWNWGQKSYQIWGSP